MFRYAIWTGHAQPDIAADLRDALTPVRVTHHAAITDPARIGELLRQSISTEDIRTEAALNLAPILFVRSLRLLAEQADMKLEGSEPEYRIPAPSMKMWEQHVVPTLNAGG